jgi:Peptidase family C78
VSSDTVSVPDPLAELLPNACQLPQGLFVCGTYTSVRVSVAAHVRERASAAARQVATALSARGGVGVALVDLVLVCCVGVSQAALRKQQQQTQKDTAAQQGAVSRQHVVEQSREVERDEPFCLCAVYRPLSAEARVVRVVLPPDASTNAELAAPSSVCVRVRLPLAVCAPHNDLRMQSRALDSALEAVATRLRGVEASSLRVLHRRSGCVPARELALGGLLAEADHDEVWPQPGDQGRVRMLRSLFVELLLPSVDTAAEVSAASLSYRPLPVGGCTPQRRRRLVLDSLAYLPATQSWADAVPTLRAALLAQVGALRRCCEGAAERVTALFSGEAADCEERRAADHFLPEGVSHRVSVLLPEPECERARTTRAHLLERLLLWPDRPLLRSPLRLYQTGRVELLRAVAGSKLIRVHTHAPASSGALGRAHVYAVQGAYLYYHYMQDRAQDSGWGCAYRSLQTICSWFALQGYVPLASVPTHRQIQETLVRIGDKQPRFAGSREWIGAIELSLCLDTLYGVSCRVLNLRSGADFPKRTAELAAHFQREGTPVMIGGGVLAYTLLGVEWDQNSDETRYLILDPHYEGGDDQPRNIIKKGWVAWKPAKLFLKDRFYNLLLPQRPHVV